MHYVREKKGLKRETTLNYKSHPVLTENSRLYLRRAGEVVIRMFLVHKRTWDDPLWSNCSFSMQVNTSERWKRGWIDSHRNPSYCAEIQIPSEQAFLVWGNMTNGKSRLLSSRFGYLQLAKYSDRFLRSFDPYGHDKWGYKPVDLNKTFKNVSFPKAEKKNLCFYLQPLWYFPSANLDQCSFSGCICTVGWLS